MVYEFLILYKRIRCNSDLGVAKTFSKIKYGRGR